MSRGERSAHGGFGIVALTGFFFFPLPYFFFLFFFLRREREVVFNSLIGVMGLEVCGNESGGRGEEVNSNCFSPIILYMCCASRKCKRKFRFIFIFIFPIHGRTFAKLLMLLLI